jgi:hypothetical protein
MNESMQVSGPLVPSGVKIEEGDRLRLENAALRLVNAQKTYDLAAVSLRDADALRREVNNQLVTLQAQMQLKYKVPLGPGTQLKEDGTIMVPSLPPRPSPAAPAAPSTPTELEAELSPPVVVEPVEMAAP